METMGDRLRRARGAAGFESARKAAQRHGWKESSYAAHENGQNEFDAERAEIYGRAFRVTAGWLLTGEGQSARSNIAKVVGLIGAGAEVSPDEEQIPPEGLTEIEVPFPIPDDALAFRVVGQSQWPRYDDGDVIICWRTGSDADQVIGWEAAVKTADGKRYLKRILRGARKGVFDLESYNAPTIRNVKLDWVARVQAVVRSTEVREISPRAAKSRFIKAM